MKKIISLFQRNYDGDRLVRDEIVPGAEWVIRGEGIATRKWDGTCCLVRDGKLFKRHDVKTGKTAPPGFEPAQEPDATTGHLPGWVPVGTGPEDKWHREAWDATGDPEKPAGLSKGLPDGTYELCGPKVQGNPEQVNGRHVLIPHGKFQLSTCPLDFTAIRDYLREAQIEGVVWWHPDGRMVKIKAKDFGIKRK